LSPQGKRRNHPNHPNSPFKEKEKVGEGRFKAWWPMEGEGEGAWLGGQWKEKEKVLFYLFHFSPQATLLKPSFFILHIKVLFCPGTRPLFTPSLHFPWPINYDRVS
jgi:hypothetical protein